MTCFWYISLLLLLRTPSSLYYYTSLKSREFESAVLVPESTPLFSARKRSAVLSTLVLLLFLRTRPLSLLLLLE